MPTDSEKIALRICAFPEGVFLVSAGFFGLLQPLFFLAFTVIFGFVWLGVGGVRLAFSFFSFPRRQPWCVPAHFGLWKTIFIVTDDDAALRCISPATWV